MMACITKFLKNSNKKYTVVSVAIVLLAWEILTFFFSPLVVPKIGDVARCIWQIMSNGKTAGMIVVTTIRLIYGLTIGILVGLFIGICMGESKIAKGILMPIIGLFQTVPPVSWVVLALVWFGFNGKPAIFIVFTSTLPIVAINICQGMEQIDKKLIKMADLYGFSRVKKLRNITIPSVLPFFVSGIRLALGTGWKIAVMGEVLTTSDGIGGMIKLARLNVEPENIIAWSVIIVFLFYLSDIVFKTIMYFWRKSNVSN